MIRPKRILIVGSSILSFLVLMPTAGHSGAQEQTNRPAQDGKVLETSVPEFEVRDQTLLEALWKLARGSSPFGFGFEEVLKNKLLDPDIPDPRFSLRLQGKSVREILDALCLSDPRYIWSIDGATIDVFPKDVVDDRSNFLNRQLERLELSNARDVNNGLFAISRQLPPPFEQIAVAQAGGADPYPPEPWTITFHNLTVRQVINRLAAHGGPCGTWIFGGANEFRSFGFFNTYLCSKRTPTWIQEMIESRSKNSGPVVRPDPSSAP
jgi:hypothetical protein